MKNRNWYKTDADRARTRLRFAQIIGLVTLLVGNVVHSTNCIITAVGVLIYFQLCLMHLDIPPYIDTPEKRKKRVRERVEEIQEKMSQTEPKL